MHLFETPNPSSASPPGRTTLVKTKDFEIASRQWTELQETEMHHHEFSQCQVYIQHGVFENSLKNAVLFEKTICKAGESITIPIGSAHTFKCLSASGQTLHFYSPPINTEPESTQFNSPQFDLNQLQLGEGVPWKDLESLALSVRDSSITTRSPYFMNQLFSGIKPESLLADTIIAQTRTTMATHEASPLFTKIEMQLVRALGQKIGWKTTEGLGVPGGSAGNFMAIHCARQRQFPHFKKQGMGSQKLRIFVSDQSHYSFMKACIVLGLGSDALIKVPSDSEGHMRASVLQTAIENEKNQGHTPLLVAATAGTTVLGSFDPIDELSQVCQKENLWLHVDGAWGGPLIFSKKHKNLLAGIEKADSLAFDAHKLLGASLTSTLFITRHKNLLKDSNDVVGGDYLFHETDCVDLGRMSWQCGRRADSFSFWLLWKSYGDDGFNDMIESLYNQRDQFIHRLKGSDRFRLIHSPEFLNVCFKFRSLASSPEDIEHNNQKIIQLREKLIQKNIAFINYSHDSKNGYFFRMIFANPHITTAHIETLIDQLHTL